MDQIHILIVEDDPIISIDLADRVLDMGFKVLGPIDKGEDAGTFFELHHTPDLVIMDYKLAGMLDGVETAELILKKKTIPIIFLTGNSDEDTFLKAKKIHPFAFLTKPFRGKDLQHSIELAIEHTSSLTNSSVSVENEKKDTAHVLKDRIFLKYQEKMIRIYYDEILWVEADDYYSKIKTLDKEYLVSQTLKKFMDIITQIPDFIRVHRSYLINLNHVEEIAENFVYIQNTKIPVSKSAREEILSRIQKI